MSIITVSSDVHRHQNYMYVMNMAKLPCLKIGFSRVKWLQAYFTYTWPKVLNAKILSFSFSHLSYYTLSNTDTVHLIIQISLFQDSYKEDEESNTDKLGTTIWSSSCLHHTMWKILDSVAWDEVHMWYTYRYESLQISVK